MQSAGLARGNVSSWYQLKQQTPTACSLPIIDSGERDVLVLLTSTGHTFTFRDGRWSLVTQTRSVSAERQRKKFISLFK